MYDSSNRAVWTRQFGNGIFGDVTGIASGTDAVFVAGHMNNSAYIKKYDLNGIELWTDIFSADSAPLALAVGSAVYSAGTVYANNTRYVFLRSFDFSGNPQWTTQLVANYSSRVNGLYANSAGLYLAGLGAVSSRGGTGVVGPFLGKFDLQGRQLWIDAIDLPGLSLMNVSGDGTGVYIIGSDVAFPYLLALFRKYDFNGGLLWSIDFQPPDSGETGDSRVSASHSGVYVIMQTGSNSFLFSFDSTGRSIWTLQLPPFERFTDRIYAGTGGIYIAGSTGADSSAILAEYSLSSSLIFFGLSPPFSFIAVSIIVGGAVLGLEFMRSRWKNGRKRGTRYPKEKGLLR
jgi:hypothetical protein